MTRLVERLSPVFVMLPLLFVDPGATFQATVDRTQVALGEQVEVSFSLSGTQAGKNFRGPSLDDFLVLSGPNQSTNFQMINGVASSSITYSYILQPKREGDLTIGPASVDFGGSVLTTKPLVIRVSKGGPGKQKGGDDGSDQIADNLFLKVEVDKSAAYQGEQITATYKIYTRVNVVNYNLAKVPTYTGFWSEDIDAPKQIQLTTETVDGRQFRVGILKRVGLFPQRSGMLEVGSMDVDCLVQMQSRRKSNDIFDQFFSDPFFGAARNVSYTVSSKPAKVNVRPLPADKVPPGFSGSVGRFQMDARIDKNVTAANEPVTLKVRISGTGNIRLLEAPSVVVPPDFDRYDPKVTDDVNSDNSIVAGSRTFEYLLIPRHAGEQGIPPISFSYFDLSRKEYVTLASPEFKISVSRGSGRADGSSSGLSKEDVKLLTEDIRFIKSENLRLVRKGDYFAGSMLFYLLSTGPMISLGAFVLLVRRRERIHGDVIGLRARRARKTARKRLVHAKHLLAGQKKEEFYTEVSRALWGFCADKLGKSPSELSIEAIRDALRLRGATDDVVSEIASIIEESDFARFAPSSDSHGMESHYKRAEKLITTIENSVR